MRIQGYSYPGYCLCRDCDPHKASEERSPVFECDESASDLTCDKCHARLSDVAGEWTDTAYCCECGGDKGHNTSLCDACDASLVGDTERQTLNRHGY